jgi:hemoglobin
LDFVEGHFKGNTAGAWKLKLKRIYQLHSQVMKSDIKRREDVDILIEHFYDRLLSDQLLSEIFTRIVPVHLPTHLPVIVDFWENILFHTGSYKRNAMDVHMKLNHIYPLQKAHFKQWVFLFHLSIDSLYEGSIADKAKEMASSIAALMEYKIEQEANFKL